MCGWVDDSYMEPDGAKRKENEPAVRSMAGPKGRIAALLRASHRLRAGRMSAASVPASHRMRAGDPNTGLLKD
jgi:hypothetical protein